MTSSDDVALDVTDQIIRTGSADADVDVLVIGGGAAGLSAATTLGRARRSVLVVDEGAPRNAPADGVHGFLGHDGIAPGELLRRGREEVERYGGVVRSGIATSAHRDADGRYRVQLQGGGAVTARRLLVTTGLVDVLPDVPGLREQWGRGVVHCPYCHGWEVREQRVAVLASGPMAAHQALMWSQWTDDLTLLLNGQEPADEQLRRLSAVGVRIVEGVVASVESQDGVLTGVRLVDGGRVDCRTLVVGAPVAARSAVLDGLGVATEEFAVNGTVLGTHVPADPTGRTSDAGVWVAGNVTAPQMQVVHAAGAGVLAAATINLDLIEQDADRAVRALSEARMPA